MMDAVAVEKATATEMKVNVKRIVNCSADEE
jgi:hypothetical protein